VKVNPEGDVFKIPNLSENLLDPACSPGGIVTKMIIDATTPVVPDLRGNYGQELDQPRSTDQWRKKLHDLVKEMRK
jgi:4-hydroxybenzoate decarboxylase